MGAEPFLATRSQKAFIATITIQAIAVLTMVAVVFGYVYVYVPQFKNKYITLPCYLALFALAEIFELAMAFDALRGRNVVQLFGILALHASLILFSAMQVHQTKAALVDTSGDCNNPESPDWYYLNCESGNTLWQKVLPFLIVAPVIISASWIAMMFWVKSLYSEFGWAIFRVVGADPKMKKMYTAYQILICMLKFDFFFFLAVTGQLLIVVIDRTKAEFGVTITAIPIVLLLLVFCGAAVQREIKWLMTSSLVMMVAAMSYFLYKLVRFFAPENEKVYATTRATLTAFTIIAFLLLLGSFAVGLRCFSDFDKGLHAAKVNAPPTSYSMRPGMKQQNSGRNSSYSGGERLQNRISIE